MQKKSLLLDKNYMAIGIVDWRKAVKLLVKQKADPIGSGCVKIVPCSITKYEIPSIIRLRTVTAKKYLFNYVKFSKKYLLMRDNYKCQYCNALLPASICTIDHVFPKSKGGKTDYLNCVTCCKECNKTKNNKTLEESGLKLLSFPKKPRLMELCCITGNPPAEWDSYIIK